MALRGHIFRITNALESFLPVVLGDDAPPGGFSPWPNAIVMATYVLDFETTPDNSFPMTIWESASTTAADGSFLLDDLPVALESLASPPDTELKVALSVNAMVASAKGRPVSGVPLYRSSLVGLGRARTKELDIWLFPDVLGETDGVTAGAVSGFVGGAGLPGNTTIQSGPTGLGFTGSEGPVSVSFSISIAPDLTTNRQTLLDINLQSWNIRVGSSTDIGETAGDVLNGIKKGMAGAEASMNATILKKMQALVTAETAAPQIGVVAPALVDKFVTEELSITFMAVAFPNNHSWNIRDDRDTTIVFFGESVHRVRALACSTRTRPREQCPVRSHAVRHMSKVPGWTKKLSGRYGHERPAAPGQCRRAAHEVGWRFVELATVRCRCFTSRGRLSCPDR